MIRESGHLLVRFLILTIYPFMHQSESKELVVPPKMGRYSDSVLLHAHEVRAVIFGRRAHSYHTRAPPIL